MRVLIVVHGFPPNAFGGAELYAQAHANALAEGGDRVFVLTREADRSRGEFHLRRELRERVEIAWINNTFASVRSFADTYMDDRIDRIAAGLIDEFKPDVAHVHHLTCLSTTVVRELAVRNVPVFHTLHDYWLLCHRGQLLDRNLQPCSSPASCQKCLGPEAASSSAAFAGRAVMLPIVRYIPDPILSPIRAAAIRLTRRAPRTDRQSDPSVARREHMAHVMGLVTHFFAPSGYLRDRFVAAGVDPERISVSEYGWTLPGPPVAHAPGEVSRSFVPLRVGFIGSLMVSKAPHTLIEACAGLPPGSCVVHIFGDHADYHGDASYRERLQPLLAHRNVRFHGHLQRDKLAAALGSIDVLAVPSIWPENSPLVIREAFMAAVPVIASRIGGIPETVADGAGGLLFAPGDAADLRRILQRLIDEPELLPRLRAGIPTIRTITDDVASMRSRYETALATPPKRRRLAAIVLNYRTPEDTFLATRSLLLSHRPIDQVIVVDNNDGGDSSRPCEGALSPLINRITYLPTGANLGFSGGMNIGIAHALDAGADAILLVNSDVVVPVHCVDALERALYATPGAGIAGPVVLGRATPDRIASHGISYNETTGRMRHRGVGSPIRESLRAAGVPADAISGCMMLVKREVFERVGRFDADYFFSFEDLDFCLRARDAGFSSIVVPAATALHEGGRSMGTDSRRFYFGARNHLQLARQRRGRSGSVRAGARSLYIVALNIAHAFRAPGGSLAGRLGAVARGTWDYFLGVPR